MRTKGISPQYTKQTNRLLVLRLLCSGQGLSRTEITRRVGLAKMTVSNITAELLRAGLIEEEAGGCAGVGRPQVELRLTAQAPAVVGLALNRNNCQAIAATMDLHTLARSQVDLCPEETTESLLGKMEALAREVSAVCGREVLGVGVASIGPLNAEQGRLLNPPDFYGIQDVPITEELSRRLGKPVFLMNNMDASALAEKLYGCGAAYHNFAYVGLSHGVGAGLVVNDSLFRGRQGFVGELGHTTIDYNGPLCACGRRGCLELYVNPPKVLARCREELGRDFPSFQEFCRSCTAVPGGRELMEDVLDKLSIALVDLCNLVDPEAVIIGNYAAFLSDAQLAWLEERVNRNVLARGAGRIPLLRSAFFTDASLYGAAALPLKRVFDGDLCYERFFGETDGK